MLLMEQNPNTYTALEALCPPARFLDGDNESLVLQCRKNFTESFRGGREKQVNQAETNANPFSAP